MTGADVPAELFNRLAHVARRQAEPDGYGGWVDVWVEHTIVPVRCSQPSASAGEQAQQGQAAITHVVYAPPGAAIGRGNRLHIDELVLDVDSVVEPSEPVYRRCACISTQHEGTR